MQQWAFIKSNKFYRLIFFDIINKLTDWFHTEGVMLFSKYATTALLFFVMFLDLLFTMWCQPDCYWEDHTECIEKTPLAMPYFRLTQTGLFLYFAPG